MIDNIISRAEADETFVCRSYAFAQPLCRLLPLLKSDNLGIATLKQHQNKARFSTNILSALIVLTLALAGCGKSQDPQSATITLKNDGSHFSGTIVRREANSITMTGAGGNVRTFLTSEIAKISYDSPNGAAKEDGSAPASPSSSTSRPARTDVVIPADGVLQFPVGTQFSLFSDGFVDSCCAPVNFSTVGLLANDVKNTKGEVVIPEGSTFVIVLADEKTVNGQLYMTFALASAQFGGRQYRISSSKGQTESGALATFTGAKAGTAEAARKGLSIHIENRTLMDFKAVNPLIFKLVQ
jgi:hypothetical protein